MAKKLVFVMVTVVLVFSSQAVAASDGTDLLDIMLGVRDTANSIGTLFDKFYVPFCKGPFLAFTQDGTAVPTYCSVGVARAFVAGQLNATGTSYTVPRGWLATEFSAFARWTAAQ